MAPCILVTVGLSHFCEKARWALDRSGIDYVESGHVPILHYAATFPRYHQRQAPLLVTPEGVLRSSSGIVEYADKFIAPPDRLYPAELGASDEVRRWVDLFDAKLGPSTRRVAYFHLLSDSGAFLNSATARVGAVERLAMRLALPGVVAAIRFGLRIDESGARRSEERIERVFGEVDTVLSDGRAFFVRNAFSAADLTFASLAAPVLLPSGYGWPLPELSRTPSAFRSLVERYRARPAGQLALRLYRDWRARRASSVPA